MPVLDELIEALREELKQYGEMLALLDQQQEFVVAHAADELLSAVAAVNAQTATVQQARRDREQRQAGIAAQLGLPPTAEFAQIVPRLPADYRPLLQALVQENNELLSRIQRRARQNHILLSRSLDLMQRFMNALFPGLRATIYNDAGSVLHPAAAPLPHYEAVG